MAQLEPNDRGEVTVPLDGQEYKLRPTFEAIVAIEGKLGPLAPLAAAAAQHSLDLKSAATIIAEMMHAYGRSNPEDPLKTDYVGAKPETLERMIFAAGTMKVQPRLAIVLLAAVTGGVTDTGELKAVAKRKAAGATAE